MNKQEMEAYRTRLVKQMGRKCHDCHRARVYGACVASQGYGVVVSCKCGAKIYRGEE